MWSSRSPRRTASIFWRATLASSMCDARIRRRGPRRVEQRPSDGRGWRTVASRRDRLAWSWHRSRLARGSDARGVFEHAFSPRRHRALACGRRRNRSEPVACGALAHHPRRTARDVRALRHPVGGGRVAAGSRLAGLVVFTTNFLPHGRRVCAFQVAKRREQHPEWFREGAATLFELLAMWKIDPIVAEPMPLVERGWGTTTSVAAGWSVSRPRLRRGSNSRRLVFRLTDNGC